jgi:hypothetical protein
MKLNRVRYGLVFIFLGALVLQLGCVIAARGRMWPEEFNALVLKVLAIYSVQLGVVLVGIFSQVNSPTADPPASLGWTALVLAGLWNVLLLWRVVSFSFAGQDSVSDLTKYLEGVGSGSAFLVAGVVAYFFGKSAGAKPGPRVNAGDQG